MLIETVNIDKLLPLSIVFDVFTVTRNLKFNSIRKTFNFLRSITSRFIIPYLQIISGNSKFV